MGRQPSSWYVDEFNEKAVFLRQLRECFAPYFLVECESLKSDRHVQSTLYGFRWALAIVSVGRALASTLRARFEMIVVRYAGLTAAF
jgi:hypothetical protein